MDRRSFLLGCGGYTGAALSYDAWTRTALAAAPIQDGRSFDAILNELSSDAVDPRTLKPYQETAAHEFVFGTATETGFSQPNRVKGRSTREVSARARLLIITSEVSNQRVYQRKGYDRPSLPGGPSGITIGFGYDIGQASVSDFRSDWQGYLDDNELGRLSEACSKSHAGSAPLLAQLQDISVSWKDARNQFTSRLLPYFAKETEVAFDNINLLSSDCFGVLLDLVYNRGSASYLQKATRDRDNPSDPRREMRNVKDAMSSRQFALIPGELRSMKRLWENRPSLKGVVDRREAEAKLFELGLSG